MVRYGTSTYIPVIYSISMSTYLLSKRALLLAFMYVKPASYVLYVLYLFVHKKFATVVSVFSNK